MRTCHFSQQKITTVSNVSQSQYAPHEGDFHTGKRDKKAQRYEWEEHEDDIKCTLPRYQLWTDVVGRNWFYLVCAGVRGRAQTIYLCMYSLSLCWGLNECIFMMWQNDGMIPPRNEAFHRNPTAACPFLRTTGSFPPCVCLLQCLSASVHVLISTHLYI